MISFTDIKKVKSKKFIESLPHEDIYQCIELLDGQIALMRYMHQETEEMLKEYDFNPAEFKVDKKYLFDFLALNMLDDFAKEFDGLHLSFFKEDGNDIYRTLASATIENNAVDLHLGLYKWNGEEWLHYFNGDWNRGPGADFFD